MKFKHENFRTEFCCDLLSIICIFDITNSKRKNEAFLIQL